MLKPMTAVMPWHRHDQFAALGAEQLGDLPHYQEFLLMQVPTTHREIGKPSNARPSVSPCQTMSMQSPYEKNMYSAETDSLYAARTFSRPTSADIIMMRVD